MEDVGGGDVTWGVPGMVAWDMMTEPSGGKVGHVLVPVMAGLRKVMLLYKRKRIEWGGAVSVGSAMIADAGCSWLIGLVPRPRTSMVLLSSFKISNRV